MTGSGLLTSDYLRSPVLHIKSGVFCGVGMMEPTGEGFTVAPRKDSFCAALDLDIEELFVPHLAEARFMTVFCPYFYIIDRSRFL